MATAQLCRSYLEIKKYMLSARRLFVENRLVKTMVYNKNFAERCKTVQFNELLLKPDLNYRIVYFAYA